MAALFEGMEASVTKLVQFSRQLAFAALVLASTFHTASAQQTPYGGPPPALGPSIRGGGAIPPAIDPRVNPGTTQMWTDSVRYEEDAYFQEPFLHNDLKLGYRLNYRFTLNLSARGLDGTARTVPDGWYLMTVAVLLKETTNIYGSAVRSLQDRFVTATSPQFVRVTGGQANERVSLKFDNVTPIALNNLLYIELLPLKKMCEYPSGRGQITRPCVTLRPDGKPDTADSDGSQLLPGYRPYLVQLPFIPFRANNGGNAVPEDENSPFGNQTLAKFVFDARVAQKAQEMAGRAPVVTAEQYAKHNGLHFVDLSDPGLRLASKRWLRSKEFGDAVTMLRKILRAEALGTVTISEKYAELMPVLCQLLYERNKGYLQLEEQMTGALLGLPPADQSISFCRYRPEKRFRLSRVIHVGKIDRTQKITTLLNPQLNYMLMYNFISSRSRSRDLWIGGTGKPLALAQPLIKFVETAGFALPFDFSYTVGQSQSQTKTEMGMTSMNEMMHLDPLGLHIPTVNSRTCLQVSLSETRLTPFFDPKGAKNGLYICDKVQARMNVREIYAHVFTAAQDSSIVKAYDPGTQAFNRLLRGDRDMSAFFVSIRSNLKPLHGPEIFPSQVAAAATDYFNQVAMAYPNMVTNPVVFERSLVPSLTQMALLQYSEKFIEEQNPL